MNNNSVRPPKIRPSGNQDTDAFSRETKKAVGQLAKTPWSTAVQLDNVVLSGVVKLVPHGLGRRFKRWCIVDRNGSFAVYRDFSSTADLTKFLPLIATVGSATVSILVE